METIKAQLISHLLTHTNFSASLLDVKKTIHKLKLQPSYPIILVAGTNGKGSCCAYLSTILSNAGYRVGTFTSPHVFEYNERIAIENKPIDDASLCQALQEVIAAAELNLGIFKTFTLAAHLIFARQQVDIAIVEVGIGGAQDATNLFEPSISAITTVALDHCELLGNSIEEIGAQKAQIYRPFKPAFFASKHIPQSVLEYAQQIHAQLELAGRDFSYTRQALSWNFYTDQQNYYSLPYPSLRGVEQLENASLALAILVELREQFPLSLAQIKAGLLQTTLIGRFQVLAGVPQIVLDTAHNPQAIDTMCENMLKLPFAKRNFALFGVAKDKNWQEIIRKSNKNFDYWYIAPLNSERTEQPQLIADYLVSLGVSTKNIYQLPNIKSAFTQCYQQLTSDDRLVCFGSFLVVEEASHAIQEVRA